jgi:AcrR family transcriptional regulator
MGRKVKEQNKIGQAMGNKGRDTRRRIIDQTMLLLRTTPYIELSAADVARACNLTPPALYLYFKGIPEIVLARLDEIKGLHHRFMDIVERPWPPDTAVSMAEAFMASYVHYWTEFGVALRYRNFMSEQGDERFRRARTEMSFPLADSFAQRIVAAQKQGITPKHLDRYAAAGAILALAEHVAGTVNAHLGKWNGQYLAERDMLNASAYMIVSLLHGPRTPEFLAEVAKPVKRKRASSQESIATID